MNLLVWAVVLLPLGLAFASGLWGAHQRVRPLMFGLLGAFTLALVALWASGEEPVARLGDLLAGEPVNLRWTGPAAPLVVAIYAALLVYIGRTLRPMEESPPASLAIVLALSSMAIAALLVDDLLARVIALDLVSVTVVALLTVHSPASARAPALWHYVPLRVADLCFLYVALQLWRGTDTPTISVALAGAADHPRGQLLAVTAAALGAAWIKLGLPPFSGWLMAASRMRSPARLTAAAFGPPLLGAYLLSRLAPAFAAAGPAVGIALALASGFLLLWGIRNVRRGADRAGTLLALHGALGLWSGLTPASGLYILSFVPVRVVILLLYPGTDAAPAAATNQAARLVDRLGHLALTAEAELEAGIGRLTRAPEALGTHLQRAHRGRLRENLLWALLALFAILLTLLVGAGGAP